MAKCRSDLLERYKFTISLHLSSQTVHVYFWVFLHGHILLLLNSSRRSSLSLYVFEPSFNLGCISHLCSKRFPLYGIAALKADHRLNIDLFTIGQFDYVFRDFQQLYTSGDLCIIDADSDISDRVIRLVNIVKLDLHKSSIDFTSTKSFLISFSSIVSPLSSASCG